MTPKTYPQNLHTPKIPQKYPKNINFSETPKNIEIQKFEPLKILPEATYAWKYQSTLPHPWALWLGMLDWCKSRKQVFSKQGPIYVK